MIEWCVAHPSHTYAVFDGLSPGARVTHGDQGMTFVKEHLVDGTPARVTLSVLHEDVRIELDGRVIRVWPSVQRPLFNGRYSVTNGARCWWGAYAGQHFGDVLLCATKSLRSQNPAAWPGPP